MSSQQHVRQRKSGAISEKSAPSSVSSNRSQHAEPKRVRLSNLPNSALYPAALFFRDDTRSLYCDDEPEDSVDLAKFRARGSQIMMQNSWGKEEAAAAAGAAGGVGGGRGGLRGGTQKKRAEPKKRISGISEGDEEEEDEEEEGMMGKNSSDLAEAAAAAAKFGGMRPMNGYVPFKVKLMFCLPGMGFLGLRYMKLSYMKKFYTDDYPKASLGVIAAFLVLLAKKKKKRENFYC